MRIKFLRSVSVLMIFTLFDFHFFLTGWNLLPDIVGYFGMFIYFTLLIDYEKRFVKAQNFALLLFLTEIALLFNIVTQEKLLFIILSSKKIMDLIMICYVLSAVSKIADAHDASNITPMIDFSLTLYICTAALWALGLMMPDVEPLFTFIRVLINIYLVITLFCCYRAIRVPLDDYIVDDTADSPDDLSQAHLTNDFE